MENQTTNDIGVLDEFQTEFVEFWRRMPNKGFFLTLLAGWLALFQFFGNATLGYVDTPSLFRWMLNSYMAHDVAGHLGDDSIGLLIPPLVLGLFWWKRKELAGLRLKLWWPGLPILGLGLAAHVVGFFIQQPRLSIVGLLTGIYGMIGMAWGPEFLRGVFFPFFLLAFLIPVTTLIEPITFPLRLVSARIVQDFCDIILGFEVVREGTMLKDPLNNYQFEVAAACSGIRSLASIGLMGLVSGMVFFKRWSRRLILLALVIPLAVAGNVLRLLTIIVAAKMGGQEWGARMHESSLFGLLPYVPGIIVLVYLGRKWEEPAGVKPAPQGKN